MKKSDLYAHGNPYGYRYNVNHPWVHPIYLEYCRGFDSPQLLGLMLALLAGHDWKASMDPSGRVAVEVELSPQHVLYFVIN